MQLTSALFLSAPFLLHRVCSLPSGAGSPPVVQRCRSASLRAGCGAGCGVGCGAAASQGNGALRRGARDAPAGAPCSSSFTPVELSPGSGNEAQARLGLPAQPPQGRAAPAAPAASQPSRGSGAGRRFGVEPRTRPFLFCLWQQGNKNTPVVWQRDDKWWLRSEVGTRRCAVLLLKHVQILLCLQHPILKRRTCSCASPRCERLVLPGAQLLGRGLRLRLGGFSELLWSTEPLGRGCLGAAVTAP